MTGGGRGSICFYSERAYPLIDPKADEFAGGAEVLVVLLARALAARGYEVSLVTGDFGQPARLQYEGITVLRAFKPFSGLPVVRFFHPRLSLGVSSLWRAAADVYYVIGAGMAAGLVHDVARLRGAGYVLHAMSDYDVGRDLSRYSLRDRWWYIRSLHDTDLLLAQTEYQQQMFHQVHRVASQVMPNIVALPERTVDAGQDGHVMWLGTYKAIKRPEWFTRLARRLPRFRFVMAGVVPPPPLTHEHWDAALAAARECPNLEVRGFQSDAELQRLLRGATVVVHTSPQEGFSNVMLEAWALGLPTVSSVNPDGVVTRFGLGAVATDHEYLVETVESLMRDPETRRAAGARARGYVERYHAPGAVLERLEELLDPLLARVRARRAR